MITGIIGIIILVIVAYVVIKYTYLQKKLLSQAKQELKKKVDSHYIPKLAKNLYNQNSSQIQYETSEVIIDGNYAIQVYIKNIHGLRINFYLDGYIDYRHNFTNEFDQFIIQLKHQKT